MAGTEAPAVETVAAVEASIDLTALGKLHENDLAKVASFAQRFVLSAQATLAQMEAAHAGAARAVAPATQTYRSAGRARNSLNLSRRRHLASAAVIWF